MKTMLALHPIEDPIEQIECLIKLAAEADTHLNIVVLGTQLPVRVATYPGSFDYSWVETFKQVLEDTEKRTAEVEKLVQEVSLSASVVGECSDVGSIEGLVSQYAIHVDAMLFPNGSIQKSDAVWHAFNGAVFDAGRPVIILGPDPKDLPSADRVLFAWNNGPEVARALHCSLAWIENTCEAHVLVVDPDGAKSGPNPGDDIAAFLSRQKMNVSVDRKSSVGKTVAQTILEHAIDVNADLIVMGAYGHSRLREWLLGGTTIDMLKNSKTPVLMAH